MFALSFTRKYALTFPIKVMEFYISPCSFIGSYFTYFMLLYQLYTVLSNAFLSVSVAVSPEPECFLVGDT